MTAIGLLLAAALGGLVCWLFMRKPLASATAGHDAARARLAQLDQQVSQLCAERDALAARRDALQAERDALDRDRARFEAECRGLVERLAESSSQLSDRERELAGQREALRDLDRELTQLRVVHQEKLAAFDEMRQTFEQSKAAMRTEFQNLANEILEEKGKAFSHTSQASLDSLLRPFREQIDGFQKRVNEVHDAAQRGHARLNSEIGRVLEIGLKMSAEANSLASALKGDKKTTGNWGEVQLERALQLAGLEPGEHYEVQASFRDEDGNRRQPDFVIKLPDEKHMVIDSKVSLVDYDRAISAETDAERVAALDEHVRAVRHHIDDLGRKDYSNLIGMRSPSFVLMFMPIEPAYIEALKHKRDLFDYGYQRNVIMVSHTTLMPILRTVANLWMIARSNEQARVLSDQAGGLYNQVALVAERLQKLGNTLGTVSNQYNQTVIAVAGQQGLYGKVNRFAELSAKANKTLPAIEPIHADLHVERLEGIRQADEPPADDGRPADRIARSSPSDT